MTEEKLIYHYTSADGLYGILTSKEIWCTNCLFLNDMNEYNLVQEYIRYLFEIRIEENDDNKLFKAVLKIILDNSEDFHAFSKEITIPYVASFSSEGNRLSQWRGYCPNGGYSLGFSMSDFTKIINKNEKKEGGFKLDRVNYIEKNKGHQDIKILFNDLCENLKKLLPDTDYVPFSRLLIQLDSLTPDEREEIKKKVEAIIFSEGLLFSMKILGLSPKFKDIAFKEEDEYRLYTRDNKNLRFLSRNNILKPYTTFQFDLESLKTIIIGPTNDYEQSELGLKIFLESKGLEHIEVKRSSIPYRTA